jgi:hypothetical protein
MEAPHDQSQCSQKNQRSRRLQIKYFRHTGRTLPRLLPLFSARPAHTARNDANPVFT